MSTVPFIIISMGTPEFLLIKCKISAVVTFFSMQTDNANVFVNHPCAKNNSISKEFYVPYEDVTQ